MEKQKKMFLILTATFPFLLQYESISSTQAWVISVSIHEHAFLACQCGIMTFILYTDLSDLVVCMSNINITTFCRQRHDCIYQVNASQLLSYAYTIQENLEVFSKYNILNCDEPYILKTLYNISIQCDRCSLLLCTSKQFHVMTIHLKC